LKKKVLIVLIILFIIASAGGLLLYKKLHRSKAVTPAAAQGSQTVASPQKEVSKRPGSYVAYDPAVLAQASDGKVVLFFNAKWSSTCKQLDQALKSNVSKLPSNFTIMSVDYDKNYALKKKYSVPFEDTFVQVDPSGDMVNRWSGSEDMSEIVALAK